MSDESKKKAQTPARRGGLGRGLGALIPSGPLSGGSSGKGHFWNALDNPPTVDEDKVRSVVQADAQPTQTDSDPEVCPNADEAAGPTGSASDAESSARAHAGTPVDIFVDTAPSAGLEAGVSGQSIAPDRDIHGVSRETPPGSVTEPAGSSADELNDIPHNARSGDGHGVSRETSSGSETGPGDSSTPERTGADNARDSSPDAGASGKAAVSDPARSGREAEHPPAVLVELSPNAIGANPKNPRQVFDDEDLGELSESIKAFGLLQPIVVREGPQGYELVMGERRLRAAKLAGIETIPVIVRQTEDDAMLRDALLENIHRVQLHPLEEAAAYQQLIDEFGVTHEELAKRIKRSRPVISNTIRLLKLPTKVQNRVAAGIISGSHARALLSLPDAEAQDALATRIIAEGMSVRATEEAVALYSGERDDSRRAVRRRRPTAPALGALAEKLSDHFDTRATVQLGRSKGKIVVEFASIDDLERIIAMMAPPLATQRLSDTARTGGTGTASPSTDG